MARFRTIISVIAWTLATVLGTGGAALAASICTDCHGMPPIDAPYRNITTGGFRGSHKTHQPVVAVAANCAVCHTGSGAYTMDHMNGTIEMASNINTSPLAATYSKGAFFNQTSNPVLGSCSNVNCHFEKATPAWSSAPLAVPGSCSACHGLPPADGSHPSLTGSGKKHGDYYGTGTTSCGKCHPDHAAEAKPFAHASSAGNRGLLLRFAAAPNTTGTYSKTANLAYPAYLPSQTTAVNRNGTCTAMYCHTDGAGGAPKSAAVWGGTLPADCTGCHGGNSASASPIVTGLHAQHVNSAAVLGVNIGCASCHSGVLAAGNDRAVTGLSSHIDGAKTVSFAGGGTWNATAKTCSASVCHSAGKATAPQPAAPAWTGAALGCNGCHGVGTPTGVPSYTSGGAGVPLANSHAKHVATAADCELCHTTVTATGAAIRAGSALHTNGAIDVTFNTARAGATATWTAGTKTCANTYCHGATLTGGTNKSPVWGATLTGCGTCHGFPPATASHTGVTATQCVSCHTHVNATGTGFTTVALHINGVIDATGGGDCISCHGTAQGTGGTTRRVVGTDTALVSRHIVAATANQTSCQVCHEQTTFGHMKTGDVAVGMFNQDTGAAVTYDGTSANNGEVGCVSCHDANGASRLGANALKPFADSGDNTAPANIGWTAGTMAHSGNMACFNCHGNSAGTAGSTTSPKFNAHGSATAKMLQYAYNAAAPNAFCYTCHGTTPANGAVDNIQAPSSATYKHVSATCGSCHDQHTAKAGTKAAGPNAPLAGVLSGATGKKFPATAPAMSTTWTGTGILTATYTTGAATAEYEVCFKCHAGLVPTATGYTAGALRMTDLGLEFNPANKSGHPVVASLNGYAGSATPKPLLAGDMVAPWTAVGTQKMTCADCHGSSGTGAKGPHGSSVRWMLTGTHQAWPFTTTAGNGAASGTPWSLGNLATGTAPNTNFCRNCHTISLTNGMHDALQSGGKHSGWASTARGACLSCHIRVPHGAKTGRLLRLGTAAVLGRYAPDGNGAEVGTSTQQVLSKYTKGTQTSNRRGAFTGAGCTEHAGGTDTW